MEKVPIHQIIASFEGNLSGKEQEKLEHWLSLSEENKQLFNEFRKTYTASGKLKIDFEPNENNGLEKVHRQIKSKQTIRLIWRAAAAVIVLLLATQIVFHTQSTNNWNEFTAQQRQTIFLPDSSKVILAQNAQLWYPETFKGNERDVKLNGTAYFEITHHPEKPFRIKTNHTKVEVLGTKFLVKADRPTFEKVLVDEGKVAFSVGSLFSRKKVILTKNEIGTWDSKQNKLSEKANPEQNSNAWLSGRFSFSRLPLADVLKTIEKHYNIKIKLTDKSLEIIKYSGQFHNSSADNIIKTICLTLNCSYEKHENSYTIKP